MPLAHYKIDSSLPELRTCSIVTCQWDLWRSEMRLKLLLIDVVDSLALFTLLCLQQVSEHFCRGLQCTHFCSPVISHALFPAQRKFTSSGAELCPQSHCSGSRCTKGCLCPSPKCIPTVRLFALGWPGLAGDCPENPWDLCLWPSAEPQCRRNMHEKQGKGTVSEITLNYNEIS